MAPWPDLPLHRDLQLQAGVVRGDDVVAETRRNDVIGFCQLLLQQPTRSQQAAELLVVGEVQFQPTPERHAQRFQRAGGEDVGGEVALGDGGGAAVDIAVFAITPP
jgi:hypothetical protein